MEICGIRNVIAMRVDGWMDREGEGEEECAFMICNISERGARCDWTIKSKRLRPLR